MRAFGTGRGWELQTRPAGPVRGTEWPYLLLRAGRSGAGRGCTPVTRANRAALRLLVLPAARMALRSFCSADGSDPLWVGGGPRGWGARGGRKGPGDAGDAGTRGPSRSPVRAPLCRRGNPPLGPERSRRRQTLGTGSGRAGRGGASLLLGFGPPVGTPGLEAAKREICRPLWG